MGKTAESPTTRFYYYNVTTKGCPRDVFTKYRCQIDTMTIFLMQRVYFNCTFHHHEISFIKWSVYEFIKDYLHNGISISISWWVMRFNICILCNLHQILTIQNICTDSIYQKIVFVYNNTIKLPCFSRLFHHKWWFSLLNNFHMNPLLRQTTFDINQSKEFLHLFLLRDK